MKRYVLLKLSPNEALLGALLVLQLALHVLAVCPSMCTCSRSHREVDCSWRGLRQLPDGLQHNMRTLNLSHNRFHNLDGQLTMYTHLRILDLSHNRLSHLPTGLPRSLWELRASSNRLHLLDKNDTVYQWNLRMLDLSNNKLERAIFINNTMISLCTLNLSYNHFWTLPTNMPLHLEVIDLSHNLLAKVLPGSLDRLPRLTHFYLHANRFSTLPFGVLDKLTSLRIITLGDNPWDCHLYADITYLLSWTQHSPARVLGCPCHTQSICGGVRPGKTGGWHFASYNLPPLVASAQDLSPVPTGVSETGWRYSVSVVLSTPHAPKLTLNTQHQPFTAPSMRIDTHLNIKYLSGTDSQSASPSDSLHTTDTSSFSNTNVTTINPIRNDVSSATERESELTHTKRTTTLRTRSVRRYNQSHPRGTSNSSPAPATASLLPVLHNLGLLSLIVQHVL